jgi:hypothetical protein
MKMILGIPEKHTVVQERRCNTRFLYRKNMAEENRVISWSVEILISTYIFIAILTRAGRESGNGTEGKKGQNELFG